MNEYPKHERSECPPWVYPATVLGLLVFIGLAFVVGGCATARDRGEQAAARGDWDTAVTEYETALKDETDVAELNLIRAELEGAKRAAGAYHLREAKRHLAMGDGESALSELELAVGHDPTEEAMAMLGKARQSEGTRLQTLGLDLLADGRTEEAVRRLATACDLLDESSGCGQQLLNAQQQWGVESLKRGESLLAEGSYPAAVDALTTAQEFHPTDDGAILLERALANSEKLAGEHRVRGNDAMRRRDWSAAQGHFEVASRFQTSCCTKEIAFAELMGRADSNASPSLYREALKMGFETDYVRERLLATEPATYIVTIRQAAILPCKLNLDPWDGIGRCSSRREAQSLLSSLSRVAVDSVLGWGQLIVAGSGFVEAPDPQLIFVDALGRKTVLARASDTLAPSWQAPVVFPFASIKSTERVSFLVEDEDEFDAGDPIGQWSTSIGELVGKGAGEHEVILRTRGDRRVYGALLGLKLSIERR